MNAFESARRNTLILLLLAAMLLVAQPAAAHDGGDGSTRVVSPDGPYTSIEAALAAAETGAVIEVHGGRYAGPLVVDKSVTLTGVGRPVIDGGDGIHQRKPNATNPPESKNVNG